MYNYYVKFHYSLDNGEKMLRLSCERITEIFQLFKKWVEENFPLESTDMPWRQIAQNIGVGEEEFRTWLCQVKDQEEFRKWTGQMMSSYYKPKPSSN